MTSRLYCVTDFKCDEKFWRDEFDNNTNMKYFYAGEEYTKEGKKHWQCVMYFHAAIRLSKNEIKKYDGRHIEKCKGTFDDNYKYCTKDGKCALELGDKPQQGKRTDLQNILHEIKTNNATEDDILEKYPDAYIKHYKFFEKYLIKHLPERTKPPEVIVIWGPAGLGKTRQVVDKHGQDYDSVEYCNGMFRGYNGKKVVLIDDFDWRLLPRQIYLRLTDRYKYIINVKYGEMNWAPDIIYITCNDDPSTWYGHDKAVLRRITETRSVAEVGGNTIPHFLERV